MTTMTDRTAAMALTSRGIRIGIATVPRQRIEVTADAALIQRALLDDRRVNDAGHRALNYVLAVIGAGLALSFWMGWL